MSETHQFQAEINQLLSLIINAFYSSKDVFLRELLSNASDALNKIRHEALTDENVLRNESKLEIQLIPNKENNTLILRDTGVGMTYDDLITKLGTIAKSGTKEFMQNLKNANVEATGDMIGQFGVGFYSAYLVADTVSVRTKHNNDMEYLWESNASGTYTITKSEESRLIRGTEITLYLKDECHEYLEESKLRELIKTHSEFISYPIQLWITKEIEKHVETREESNDNDEPLVEKDDDKNETVKETVNEFEHVNKTQPLWTRDQTTITQEEYETFYKHLTNDWEAHSAVRHFKVEGNISFTGLLFIPQRAPFEMFQQHKKLDNLKLYVRKVFITDNCQDLVPEYLNFVKGVIDSEDLPLNVSREFFQNNNKVMKTMRKQIVKKCIEMFNELAEDKEKYEKFYEGFSKNLKLGVHEDNENRDKLAKLLRFKTAKCDNLVSLDDYVDTMPESQTDIYYLAGENYETLKTSPFVEKCMSKGYDILFLTETIDEYAIQTLKDYREKKLLCLAKDNVSFDDVDAEQFTEFCEGVKNMLKDQVDKVVVSSKLTSSPCCLTVSEHMYSPNMLRIMRAQALSNNMMHQFMMGKKTLELNMDNDIIKAVKAKYDENKEDPTVMDIMSLLYESGLIDSGFSLDTPKNYTERIYRMIRLGLNLEEEHMEEPTNEISSETDNLEEID
jgi:molecular chaperone HtpG